MKKNAVTFLILLLTIQLGWAQTKTISSSLKEKVKNASLNIKTNETNSMDPLSLNAVLVWSDDKSQLAIVMKASLEDEWHIYAYVPKTQPYITSELQLELPKGITTIGKWETPPNEAYNDGVYIYHGELVFVQYCSVATYNKVSKITCGLYYQTCDLYKCYPPETKTKDLRLQ